MEKDDLAAAKSFVSKNANAENTNTRNQEIKILPNTDFLQWLTYE